MSPSRRRAVIVNEYLGPWRFVNVNTITACGRTLFGEDAAIAGLVLRDETVAPDEPTAAATPPTASLRARLDIVESLRTDGAISDDEADRRRAEILREI